MSISGSDDLFTQLPVEEEEEKEEEEKKTKKKKKSCGIKGNKRMLRLMSELNIDNFISHQLAKTKKETVK